MEQRRKVLSTLETEFKNSPIRSNVVLGFILIGLEKIMEWEFECPCHPEFNSKLAAAYFFVPTFLVYLLMIAIQKCSCKSFFLSFVPALIWLNLIFLDGKYLACANTDWTGEYVSVSGSSRFKWCEPFNKALTEEYLKTTQHWFTQSQTIGMWTMLVHIIPLFCQICMKCCKGTEDRVSSTDGGN